MTPKLLGVDLIDTKDCTIKSKSKFVPHISSKHWNNNQLVLLSIINKNLGAGYAGGIISTAIDGEKGALKIGQVLKK